MAGVGPPAVDPALRRTLDRLLGLSASGVKLGLERMESLLARAGDPRSSFSTVHVAGTNGKGSTVAMLESCLRHGGVRTGLYTSPHLCRFSERIKVCGEEISPRDLEPLLERIVHAEPNVTFFEAATAAALLHFALRGVDLAVLETGMGGRLDATNVVLPLVSVITALDLDHTQVLGDTVEAIAAEKAGIIKPGVPVVCAAQHHPGAMEVIERRCRDLRCELLFEGRDFALSGQGGPLAYFGVNREIPGIRLGLLGAHQRQNAALCLAALEVLGRQGVSLQDDQVVEGLARVHWPGRMEWVGGRTLLDGAHNEAGFRVLSGALAPRQDFCAVMGLLAPRQPEPLLEALGPRTDRIIFTRPRSPRAWAPEQLAARCAGAEHAPDLAAALARCSGHAGPILVCGSLYLVGEARALLLGEPADPLDTWDPLGRVR